MASFIQFFIAAAVLTTVLGQNYNYNKVSNGTQDYLKIVQAELLYKINLAEMENNAVDVRFLDRLAVIELQQKQILNETQQFNQTIIPLPALSLTWKYCVQKYDSQLVKHQIAKDQFNACNVKAQQAGAQLTYKARLLTEKARGYVLRTLPSYANECPVNDKNQTRVEQCYINYVSMFTQYVQDNLDKAQASRDQSIFDMNSIALSAVQCSFRTEKVVLDSISLTAKNINDCLNGQEKLNVFRNAKALN
ncbi:uncharacterized protein LOC129909608 [Episyrphus balteatus]|uniref:uncharacterized protein LOC129909608 n=1 Tax=Episyrphus balteatus TaxID=286459 RepID=UPI0024850F8A|nr:uncharacterized protein LOC129909608 [Episyrphus balteatus]